ncbi:MAG: DUF72 domain-containing protein, partial [Gaiellaceae bacterium]
MSPARRPGQLDLFAAPSAAGGRSVQPAPVAETLRQTAERMPATIRLGTSSWSFPGWAGIVYDTEVAQARLARNGLAAYAQHPLLRTVGVDRSYYGPLSADVFAAYAHAVPEDFRFLVKAHELCTIDRFPEHPRYGAQQGARNALFLDASYAADTVVAPFVEGLGPRAGPLLFQFPPHDVAALGGRDRFAERLHGFLRALPHGPLYAVEIRNTELLTPAYVDALVDADVSHCVSAHPRLPPVATQARIAQRALSAATVIRWMLPRGVGYEAARERYR